MTDTNLDIVNAEHLFVLDTTAQHDRILDNGQVISGDNVHDLRIDDRVVPTRFKRGVPTRLPRAVALRMAERDPAFILCDENGRSLEYRPRPKMEGATNARAPQLRPDHVIAHLDELTTDALVVRCNITPGGDAMTKKDGRSALIEFLTRAAAAASKTNGSVPRAGNQHSDLVAEDGIMAAGAADGGLWAGAEDEMNRVA